MTRPRWREATTRSRHRDLVESIPVVVYEAEPGPDGAWSYVAPQIENLLGYRADEWIADPLLWASRIHPDDRATVHRIEARDSGHGSAGEVSITEYRMLRRDGREIWVRDEAQLVSVGPGLVVWRGTLSDITDAREAERSMVEAYERILEAVQEHVELVDNRLAAFAHGVRDFPRERGQRRDARTAA